MNYILEQLYGKTEKLNRYKVSVAVSGYMDVGMFSARIKYVFDNARVIVACDKMLSDHNISAFIYDTIEAHPFNKYYNSVSVFVHGLWYMGEWENVDAFEMEYDERVIVAVTEKLSAHNILGFDIDSVYVDEIPQPIEYDPDHDEASVVPLEMFI